MTFLDRLKFLFSRKDSQTRVLMTLTQTGPYVPTPREFLSFAKEGYQKNVIAYRSVALVARSLGGIPWVLYKKGRGSRSKPRQEIDSHPLLDLLKRPNPMMAQSTFMEYVTSFKLIAGNSYVQAVGPGKDPMKQVTELWPMRPDRVKIKPGLRGYPAVFIYTIKDKEVEFDVDQVKLSSPILHLKFFHPTDDWYGMSPIEAAAMGVDQHNSAQKWNIGLMQNGARPSGALTATVTDSRPGTIGDEQFARLKQQIEESHAGPSNAGKIMILEGGMQWIPFSFNPQQMEWIENKNTSSRDISLAFGVPPMLLGIPGDNTYSNYQEARSALYDETILPEHDSQRDELNSWLVPTFGDGLELDSDKDSIHALAPRRALIWDKVAAATWLTVNEKREATGYDEIEEGDLVLVNSTQMPLEDAIADPDDSNDDTDPTPGAPDPADPSDPNDDGEEGDQPGKAVKLFNLTNDKSKRREWKAQLRLRKGLERRLSRQAQAAFIIEGKRVVQAIDGLDHVHAKIAAEREIDSNVDTWKNILTSNLFHTAKVFGDRTREAMKSDHGVKETKDAESHFDSLVKHWIQSHVGKRIKNIAATSRDRVIAAIQKAQEENYVAGESITELSKSIQDSVQSEYDSFESSRAMTIARTEVGTASNYASRNAAKASGVPNLQKEWVGANDDRERDSHNDVDGTVIPIDEDFDVGDAKMKGPMDPDGPPEEVINCRCVQVFSRGDPDPEDDDEAAVAEEEAS